MRCMLKMLRLQSSRCRVSTPLRVERRWDHGGLGPKSKREKEIRLHRTEDCTGTRPNKQRTRTGNDTDRHNQRICTYEHKKIAEKDVTTHGGHGIDAN